MTEEATIAKIGEIIDQAKDIVVIQADNPDGDSMASALALEDIFSELGKTVHLYCGVDVPSYLRHLPGWDRISNELPTKFDASVIVDTSAITLLEQLDKTKQLSWLGTRPCVVIDHHTDVPCNIPFATAVVNSSEAVSTGELIYEICNALKWQKTALTNDFIAQSILSDSLGLMSEGVTARTMFIMAELVEAGVSLAILDEERKKLSKRSAEITEYKGRLLQRIEYYADGRLAIVAIPWNEIEKYSNAYNPSMLVLDEMRMVEGVQATVAFKVYKDGKITGKIRCNRGFGIGADLAAHFGGGGHVYAAGFKITQKTDFTSVKSACIDKATHLLDTLPKQD